MSGSLQTPRAGDSAADVLAALRAQQPAPRSPRINSSKVTNVLVDGPSVSQTRKYKHEEIPAPSPAPRHTANNWPARSFGDIGSNRTATRYPIEIDSSSAAGSTRFMSQLSGKERRRWKTP